MWWILGAIAAYLVYEQTRTSAPPAPAPPPASPGTPYLMSATSPAVAAPSSAPVRAMPVLAPSSGAPVNRVAARARAGGVAHGGADLGWQPSLAAAQAAAQKMLGPQGFAYVTGNPSQPGTFTVIDNGPVLSGGRHTYSVEFALAAGQAPPSVFVAPSF